MTTRSPYANRNSYNNDLSPSPISPTHLQNLANIQTSSINSILPNGSSSGSGGNMSSSSGGGGGGGGAGAAGLGLGVKPTLSSLTSPIHSHAGSSSISPTIGGVPGSLKATSPVNGISGLNGYAHSPTHGHSHTSSHHKMNGIGNGAGHTSGLSTQSLGSGNSGLGVGLENGNGKGPHQIWGLTREGSGSGLGHKRTESGSAGGGNGTGLLGDSSNQSSGYTLNDTNSAGFGNGNGKLEDLASSPSHFRNFRDPRGTPDMTIGVGNGISTNGGMINGGNNNASSSGIVGNGSSSFTARRPSIPHTTFIPPNQLHNSSNSMSTHSHSGSNGPIHRHSHGGHGHGRTYSNGQSLGHSVKQSISSLPKPPIPIPSLSTIRFIFLCTLWYGSSALSSNTGKLILNAFRFPVTLTIVQFFFVAGYCWLGSRRELGWTKTRLRDPTKKILQGTLPMAVFQVGGHIFSSLAISRVPVSTVHTIKALSPLFTVLAYALMFGVKYSPATYLSLLPLTSGVMLACSFDMSASNAFGLVCAFGSTLVFVSSNIVFKKLMPSPGSGTSTSAGSGSASSAGGISSAASGRLDKINLLFYSSGMAFILMIPIWAYSDLPTLLFMVYYPEIPLAHNTPVPKPASTVALYFFLNGTVHFAQNLLAFAILSSTSPVTYSIASLVKRIAVICLAIVWFNQSVHPIQALGIGLTGVGLWMYNKAKKDVERGEKKVRRLDAVREGLLPLNSMDQRLLSGSDDSRPSSPAIGYLQSEKLDHHSPTPSYSHTFYSEVPLSTSSAIRPAGFSLPPQSHPFPPGPPRAHEGKGNLPNGNYSMSNGTGSQPQVNLSMTIQEPYPSPPPSNASSPPFSSIDPPTSHLFANKPVSSPNTPHMGNNQGVSGMTMRRRSNETAKGFVMTRPAAEQARLPGLGAIPPSPGSELPPSLMGDRAVAPVGS